MNGPLCLVILRPRSAVSLIRLSVKNLYVAVGDLSLELAVDIDDKNMNWVFAYGFLQSKSV